MNKNGETMWENLRIINFNDSNNKKISSIKTMWGEPLVDFHHGLFCESFPKHTQCMTDISDWLHTAGPHAIDYYKQFLTLFLRDGILFENFLLEKNEFGFTQQVVLPAFLAVMKETGLKPLVVALEPTDIEADNFWQSHPYTDMKVLERFHSKDGL